MGWRRSVGGCLVVCLVDRFFPLHHQYPLSLFLLLWGCSHLRADLLCVPPPFFLLFHIVTIIIISWVMLYCRV